MNPSQDAIDLLGQTALALGEAQKYDDFVASADEGQTFKFPETDVLFKILDIEAVQKLCLPQLRQALLVMPRVLRQLERKGYWDRDEKLLDSLRTFNAFSGYIREASSSGEGENIVIPMMVFVYKFHDAMTESSGIAPTTHMLQ